MQWYGTYIFLYRFPCFLLIVVEIVVHVSLLVRLASFNSYPPISSPFSSLVVALFFHCIPAVYICVDVLHLIDELLHYSYVLCLGV